MFDLDGTLVDSVPDIAAALNDLFAEQGWSPFAEEEVRGMVGGGVPKLIERALRARELAVEAERHAALAARFIALYGPRATRQTRPYPGVRAVLEQFAASGTAMAVCTNKPEAITRAMIAELGLGRFFGAFVGGDTLAVKKPAPEPVLEALGQLGCPRSGAVMVGDSGADAKAARAAGLPVVLVTYGYSREPVAQLGADALVDSFCELPRVLSRLPTGGHTGMAQK
ncbi:MAG: phosphoglycolate phosphatase [Methyloligellaceae bacterium]